MNDKSPRKLTAELFIDSAMTQDQQAMSPAMSLLGDAIRAHERGDLPQAGLLALQATQLEPNNALAHFLTGTACLEAQQLNRALEHLGRSFSLDSKNAESATHFAVALARAQRLGEALQIANIAYALPLAGASTMDALGSVYMQCNAHERADILFQRAINLAPHNARYNFNAAVTATFTGNLEVAEEQFNACIKSAPTFWSAYSLRSRLKLQTQTQNHIDALRALLVKYANDVDAQIHLHGALGKEYEDLGKYTEAFENLSVSKATARKRVAYQSTQDSAMIDALIKAFPREITDDSGYGSDEPIFIVGMPRSGTTLVERIVSSHPQVYSAGELMNFSTQIQQLAPADIPARLDPTLIAHCHRIDYERLGLRYVDSTRPQTANKPRFIDKLPHNFLYLGLIAKALPKAKIICLRRHPLDACLSNFRETFMESSSFHGYSFDLLDIGRFYIQFDRLMTHWKAVMPGRILEISYETLVAEQEVTTRQMLTHCDLSWNDACLHFEKNTSSVATASTVQVREPIHRKAVGRWEKYRPMLGPLERLLNDAGIETAS